jgi:hypothetical protein
MMRKSTKATEQRGALKGVLAAAGSLRKKISQTTNHKLTGIEIRVSGQKGNFGGSAGVAYCTFIIQGHTAEEAYAHAKDLEKQGCVCTSSGETEVTCKCDDVD